MRAMILAADVGGTKTLVGLFETGARAPKAVRRATFPSQDRPSFEAILEEFVGSERLHIRACGIGVAGPVIDGRSGIVNLPWSIDARKVARRFGIERVGLLNDLEAWAWSLRALPPSKLRNLTPGLRPRPGNAGLIAAGTGLGTACLWWDGAGHRPSPAEGGHAGWAPLDPREIPLWDKLRALYGRVSIERVCAAPGISTIYDHLAAGGREPPGGNAGDRNAAISTAALHGTDSVAVDALDLWVRHYGAAAGDLALSLGAVGGMYVGGSVARKILPKLEDGTFVKAFRDKGRLTEYVSRIPIKVVIEPHAALVGAAAFAATLSLRKGKR